MIASKVYPRIVHGVCERCSMSVFYNTRSEVDSWLESHECNEGTMSQALCHRCHSFLKFRKISEYDAWKESHDCQRYELCALDETNPQPQSSTPSSSPSSSGSSESQSSSMTSISSPSEREAPAALHGEFTMDPRFPGAFVIRNTMTRQVLHADPEGKRLMHGFHDEESNRDQQIWWIDIAGKSVANLEIPDGRACYTITNMATGLQLHTDWDESTVSQTNDFDPEPKLCRGYAERATLAAHIRDS